MTSRDLTTVLKRLANEPTYSAYSAAANALSALSPEASELPILRVVLLRNFTLDPLIPVIKGEIALAGFYPQVYVGDYDAIARDVLNPASPLYAFQPDFVIVAQWMEPLTPGLSTRFLSLSSEQVAIEIERVLNAVRETITSLRQNSKAPIILNNFPLPAYPTLGVLDAQSEAFETHSILKLNTELLRMARQWRDVYLIDYMRLMARVGSAQGVDERYWQIGRSPIAQRALLPFGQEYGRFFRALRGKSRKCLVLDCDNTLWGGIVGEDGIGGIKVGTTYPGSSYQAFQREILNLRDRGVILALCSKNNEADVLEVLRTHPEMVLRETHLAAWQINWDDKVTNLKCIAQDLNIGLDSLVFVDDSQFECEFVREQLPQVAVLHLSGDPSSFRFRLSAAGFFDALTLSSEDHERNQMYRDETQRKQLLASAGSIDQYLARLEMVAEIGCADAITIPRISQLTQKTNQVNLTTRRYTEGDIHAFADSPGAAVYYLRLRDRVSDLGLVGVAIAKYHGEQTEIDSFLLSCRAIGRGAEEALLAHMLNVARARGCTRVVGRYLVTKKNGQVTDFYRRQGFRLTGENAQGTEWVLLLDHASYAPPAWIKVEIVEREEQDAGN